MKNQINTKELCKKIRQGAKYGGMIWSREADRHFISNQHWLIKFEELPREVIIALFSVFCKIADVGQTLKIFAGMEQNVVNPIPFDKTFQPDKANVVGTITPFFKILGNKQIARVVKFPEHFAILNEEYVKFAKYPEEVRTTGTDPRNPIYLADGDLMILPYWTKDQQLTNEMKEMEGVI